MTMICQKVILQELYMAKQLHLDEGMYKSYYSIGTLKILKFLETLKDKSRKTQVPRRSRNLQCTCCTRTCSTHAVHLQCYKTPLKNSKN